MTYSIGFDTRRHVRLTARGDWDSLTRELEISLHAGNNSKPLVTDIQEKASVERSFKAVSRE